jgi:selenocysteine-specific elongation factor
MPFIVGTAGHIDHGKTALIKALTGIETDRLKEEKERGISIDLGFAHFDVGDGEQAGVVDVPGHERFIRNMLAGAHGIDLVLLVVAADDGVMPQTEEHFDIVHLLGVRHGIVALTKVDLVEPARRAEVRQEIEILLAGTALEGAPVFEVSSVTGEGIEELRAALAARLAGLTRPEPKGCFRLPVDRAFLMRGHGLVVTGTAIAGTVRSGATVRILPGGGLARVRGIQVHGCPVDEASYGERVALNLGGAEREQIARGHVVCDPDLDRVTDRFAAWVELRPAARRPLASHALVRLHLGTTEVLGKVVWLDGRAALEPRGQACAQLVLREPIAAFGGDRFILRDQTARGTIGGGVVLHPFSAPAVARPDPRLPLFERLREARDDAERLDALLAIETAFAVAPERLAAAANLRVESVRSLLRGHAGLRPLPDADAAEAYTTTEKWDRLSTAVGAALERFHAENPRAPGVELESLRSQLAPDLTPKVFRSVVSALEKEAVLVREESTVRLPAHRVGLDDEEERLAERVLGILDEAGLTPPDLRTIEASAGIAGARLKHVLEQLERGGRAVRVAPDLYFASAAVEKARALLRGHVAAHGEITAAAFRDLIQASRKFSIALLDYFDRTRFTMRIGDVRKVR